MRKVGNLTLFFGADDQGTGASPGVQSGVSREFGC
jgi:hypothetical protein